MRHTEWCNDFTGTLLVDNPQSSNDTRLNYSTIITDTAFNLNFSGRKICSLHIKFRYIYCYFSFQYYSTLHVLFCFQLQKRVRDFEDKETLQT